MTLFFHGTQILLLAQDRLYASCCSYCFPFTKSSVAVPQPLQFQPMLPAGLRADCDTHTITFQGTTISARHAVVPTSSTPYM